MLLTSPLILWKIKFPQFKWAFPMLKEWWMNEWTRVKICARDDWTFCELEYYVELFYLNTIKQLFLCWMMGQVGSKSALWWILAETPLLTSFEIRDGTQINCLYPNSIGYLTQLCVPIICLGASSKYLKWNFNIDSNLKSSNSICKPYT